MPANTGRKYRVLLVHNYYQIPGGEDTVFLNEKRLLEEHGHQVVIYTRHNDEIKNGSKLKKLSMLIETFFSFRTYREIRALIKQNNIDIVHVHNILPLVSPSVYYAAFRNRVPAVMTHHNFRLLCASAVLYRDGHICEECAKKGGFCAVRHGCYRKSRIQTSVLAFLTWFYKKAGLYRKIYHICLTDFNRRMLLNAGKEKKWILSDHTFVKPNFTMEQTRLIPYDERKKQMIYLGRLEKIKGVELLFQAWKKYERQNGACRLFVCGTGELEKWCFDYIEENSIQTVHLMGFCSHEDVLKILAESRAMIMPTQWYEGFGMNVIESFSCGTPVIGSDIGNVADLIIDGENGWRFQHDSVDDLVVKMEQVTDIVESTHHSYMQNYAPDSNYKKLVDIYDKICMREMERGNGKRENEDCSGSDLS